MDCHEILAHLRFQSRRRKYASILVVYPTGIQLVMKFYEVRVISSLAVEIWLSRSQEQT